MSQYLRQQGTAARLIKKFGAPFQIRRMVDGVKDPVAGTVSGKTPQIQTVDVVVLLPSSNTKSLPVEQMTGENLLQLSKVNNLLISPITPTFKIEPLQEIFYENTWWIMEFVSPLKPDGKTLILTKAFMKRK